MASTDFSSLTPEGAVAVRESFAKETGISPEDQDACMVGLHGDGGVELVRGIILSHTFERRWLSLGTGYKRATACQRPGTRNRAPPEFASSSPGENAV